MWCRERVGVNGAGNWRYQRASGYKPILATSYQAGRAVTPAQSRHRVVE